MNKKGLELDELNPVYVLLSIVAGAIGFFVSSRVPDVSIAIPIIAGIGSVIIAYAYLVLTDR